MANAMGNTIYPIDKNAKTEMESIMLILTITSPLVFHFAKHRNKHPRPIIFLPVFRFATELNVLAPMSSPFLHAVLAVNHFKSMV